MFVDKCRRPVEAASINCFMSVLGWLKYQSLRILWLCIPAVVIGGGSIVCFPLIFIICLLLLARILCDFGGLTWYWGDDGLFLFIFVVLFLLLFEVGCFVGVVSSNIGERGGQVPLFSLRGRPRFQSVHLLKAVFCYLFSWLAPGQFGWFFVFGLFYSSACWLFLESPTHTHIHFKKNYLWLWFWFPFLPFQVSARPPCMVILVW